MKLTVGSCFSGIGGLELGLEWTGGFETKWQIEIDPYASKVLTKHWPNVQRFSDITAVSQPPPVDVICGGFPCQDVSMAGARAGLKGKRSTLWGEMFRLICEVRPQWVVAENVPGLFSSDDGQFFGNILRDLASAGYDAEWGVLSASGVGAPHLRRRVFIIAYSTGQRTQGRIPNGEWTEPRDDGHPQPMADANNKGSQRRISEVMPERSCERVAGTSDSSVSNASRKLLDGCRREGDGWPKSSDGDWWSTEPDVGRVAHGVPSRVDRLTCLGNAVVPQVAQKIGEMILRGELI